jgi:hypothetical protein
LVQLPFFSPNFDFSKKMGVIWPPNIYSVPSWFPVFTIFTACQQICSASNHFKTHPEIQVQIHNEKLFTLGKCYHGTIYEKYKCNSIRNYVLLRCHPFFIITCLWLNNIKFYISATIQDEHIPPK